MALVSPGPGAPRLKDREQEKIMSRLHFLAGWCMAFPPLHRKDRWAKLFLAREANMAHRFEAAICWVAV